jgi:hypothetical protein
MSSALGLLNNDDAERVAALVVRDNEGVTDQAQALAIVDEALKFLSAATTSKPGDGRRLRPSRVVDMGWHALILHTELYMTLCHKIGRYIHHRPEGPETLRREATTLDITQAAIREAGYEPVEYFWGTKGDTEIKGGDCQHTECHQDPGCTAPPVAQIAVGG